MFNKFFPQGSKEQQSNVTLFFSVFTLIFFVMTIIILRVLNTGIYDSVDKSLTSARENINHYVNFQMARMEISQFEELEAYYGRPKHKPDHDLVTNTDIVLYNAKGEVLNLLDIYGQFVEVELDKTNLDKPIQIPLENYWGKTELYRTMTVRITNLNHPEVAFATILINTDQLEASNSRSVKIIVSVMVIFWIISLFASLYLAEWTRRPIVESYERQKAFVENASHELRTPLAVLQNRLEGLFRKPDETILDNSESIAASLDEVRNMKLLTSNLFELTRRDNGLTPDWELIPPSFFDDIFANYDLIAEENGKHFTFSNHLTGNLSSDRTLIKQLLTILFDNAIKYTEADGQIAINLRTGDKQVYLEVSDDGLGIKDEDKERVFDRFYRVDKARTRHKGGFGLGLSLAKQIITSLGGQIAIKDNYPKGTIFEVKLPKQPH